MKDILLTRLKDTAPGAGLILGIFFLVMIVLTHVVDVTRIVDGEYLVKVVIYLFGFFFALVGGFVASTGHNMREGMLSGMTRRQHIISTHLWVFVYNSIVVLGLLFIGSLYFLEVNLLVGALNLWVVANGFHLFGFLLQIVFQLILKRIRGSRRNPLRMILSFLIGMPVGFAAVSFIGDLADLFTWGLPNPTVLLFTTVWLVISFALSVYLLKDVPIEVM